MGIIFIRHVAPDYQNDSLTKKGRHGVPWDFMPQYWAETEEMYDKSNRINTLTYRANPELAPAYGEVCAGINSIQRSPGRAISRTQAMGDTAHLLQGGEPVSAAGYITDAFSW